MTRGAMRRLLRRRLNDVSTNNPFFTDSDLDEALNLGAAKIEKSVLALDPMALIKITTQNIEAGEDMYPKPQGVWTVLDVKMLQSDGSYRTLGDPISVEDLEKLALTGASASTRYAFVGRYIQLAPTPDASVTAGLKWRTVFGSEITSGIADDGEVYPFPTGIHNAIVLWAQVLLQPEFEEGANTQELRTQISEELADLPLYYRRTVGREVPFQPDVRKLGAGGFNRRGGSWNDGPQDQE